MLCKSERGRRVRSSGLREGPRNFDFPNHRGINEFKTGYQPRSKRIVICLQIHATFGVGRRMTSLNVGFEVLTAVVMKSTIFWEGHAVA
jgi:hypothetical protein